MPLVKISPLIEWHLAHYAQIQSRYTDAKTFLLLDELIIELENVQREYIRVRFGDVKQSLRS